jgi:hypothetical protein
LFFNARTHNPSFHYAQEGGGDDDDDDDDADEDEERVEEVAARAAAVRARADASLSGWGKKKSAYYEENAEGEVDEEAAAEEEREARRLQGARAAALDEDDVTFGTAAAAATTSKGAGSGSGGKRARGGGGAALTTAVERVTRDVGALSRSAKLDIVMADAPELVALLGEAQAALASVRSTVAPILEAARAGRIPRGAKGLSYLQVKLQLWLTYVTDIAFFLLLKAEGAAVKEHPVVAQLLHVRTLLEKMRPLDARLQFQVARLLKAAAAGEGGGGGGGGDGGGDEREGVDYSDLPDHPEARRRRILAREAAAAGASDHATARPNLGALLRHGDTGLARGAAVAAAGKPQKEKAGKGKRAAAAAAEENEGEEEEEEEGGGGGGARGGPDWGEEEEGGGVYRPLQRAAVPYDGDGARGKATRTAAHAAARAAKSALLTEIRASYSARPEEESVDGVGGVRGRRGAAAAAAAAAEEEERTAHEEDTFTRLTLSRAQKARQKARAAGENQWDAFAELEDFGDIAAAADGGEDGGGGVGGGGRRADAAAAALRARLARSVGAAAATGMDTGFGKKRASAPAAAALALEEEEGGGGDGGSGEEGGGEDPFFAAVAAAAAMKRAKKAAAAAAAGEQRAALIREAAEREDAPLDAAAGGHRKASKQILKNRGLVKYRKKEAANPRVAYRLKAEKQLKRRQGQAVTMRSKHEGDDYGGEATGIRTNISKSRIFKS